MALLPILLIMVGVIVVPVLVVLLVMYVLVPAGKGIGWFVAHLFEFVTGLLGDTFRLISTVPAVLVLGFMTVGSVALGRWSSAAHFGRSVRREMVTAGTCLYGIALRRPLKLFWLHGLLEGVEQRVPEAVAGAPGRDRPSRTGQFDGYTIVGSLPSGGSGAKLYIAEPDARTLGRVKGMPARVVIKSFTLEEGSALPQIVRESRALESAKRLGAVYEHGMDARRFWYAMPYYRGDHLGIATRQLHAESGESGLDARRLRTGVGYVADLADTLLSYHREGLWHKDVKPENVIITDDGAHLVDLGLVTPLQSAMTLTTHGTEYFRDPELVRQALRGVKVHQVDGAKFDVFGIGAVLYFVIENDFPAHGPLSRFRKKSPDAIKWIIRRAMADYHHRYDSAEALVADLRVVANASDPFAVKPAELPSVRSRAGEDETSDEAPVVEVAGAEPVPDAPGDGAAAAVAGAAGAAAADAAATGRPRLRRKGFWGSGYDVLDDVDQAIGDAMKEADDAIAGAAAGANPDVTVIGFGIGTGAGSGARSAARSARKAAGAVRREARKAAADAKRHARKVRTEGRRRPAMEGLMGAMFIVVFVVTGILWLTLGDRGRSDGRQQPALATAEGMTTTGDRPAIAVLGGHSLQWDQFATGEAVERILVERTAEGYDVVEFPPVISEQLRSALEWWESSNGGDEADAYLEDQLEAWGLYGVLSLRSGQHGDVHDRLVYSTRGNARDRIPMTLTFDLPDDDRPMLLVNDHPRRVQPDVASRVDALVEQLEGLGWAITRDPEIEADLRTVLPIRTDAADVPMTPVLADRIKRHDLSGVLRVIGRQDDGRRMMLQIVRPDEVQARTVPVPPAAPPTVMPGQHSGSSSSLDSPSASGTMSARSATETPWTAPAAIAEARRVADQQRFLTVEVLGGRESIHIEDWDAMVDALEQVHERGRASLAAVGGSDCR